MTSASQREDLERLLVKREAMLPFSLVYRSPVYAVVLKDEDGVMELEDEKEFLVEYVDEAFSTFVKKLESDIYMEFNDWKLEDVKIVELS